MIIVYWWLSISIINTSLTVTTDYLQFVCSLLMMMPFVWLSRCSWLMMIVSVWKVNGLSYGWGWLLWGQLLECVGFVWVVDVGAVSRDNPWLCILRNLSFYGVIVVIIIVIFYFFFALIINHVFHYGLSITTVIPISPQLIILSQLFSLFILTHLFTSYFDLNSIYDLYIF